MVFVILRQKELYSASDNVSKSLENLRPLRFLTSFKLPYPNMKEILISQYGLTPEQDIWVQYIVKNKWGHRSPFHTPYRVKLANLEVKELYGECRKLILKNRAEKKRKKALKNAQLRQRP